MCASVREPESWRPRLLGQQHSAFSVKNKSEIRKNAIDCGIEPLSGTVRRDSTNTCGAAALSQYPVSPPGRRLFAAVACWCCFLLTRYRSTDFPQNPQHRQINSAAIGDFAAQYQQQNQQILSMFYSGASPFPSLDVVAAAGATPPTHAAQAIPVENKQPPSPAELDSALHADGGRPSRRGNAEGAALLAGVTAVDPREEPLARTSYGSTLQQQHRHGSIKDREEGEEEEKKKGERGSPNQRATTEQVKELMQQPGKGVHKQRLPSTEFLQSFTGRLARRRSLLEKLMIGENSSSQSEENKGQRQPNEGWQLLEEPESNAALESPVQPSATAATPAAPVSTASPDDVSPYIEGDPSYSAYTQRATRRWEQRAPAEGSITGHGRGDGTSESGHHGASPATQAAHTDAHALQHVTGGARADGADGASTVPVASSSSGLRFGGLYTIRRRLGSVPETATIHSFSTGNGSRTLPDLSTSMRHQAHAPREDAVAETAQDDDTVGGLFGEPTLSQVSRNRNMRRRRRGRDAPRQSLFGSTWGSTTQEPVAGVIAGEHHTRTLLDEEKTSAGPLLPQKEAGSVLNDVFGTPMVDATRDRGLSAIPGVSPLPSARLHSVIEVGVPPVAVHGEPGPLAVPPLAWEAQVHQQQLPFGEKSGSEALQTTGERGPYDLVLVTDQLQNGGEVVALPPVGQEEVEESEDVVLLMRKPYLLRPLRTRQRVLLALSILVNALSVIVFGSLSARLMSAYSFNMSFGFLMLSWLGLMALGENIKQAVTAMTNAARLLIEDFNLRRQRHKLLDVAEAIKEIREAHANAAYQERASKDVHAVEDNLGGAGVDIVQHGAESPAQPRLVEASPWL